MGNSETLELLRNKVAAKQAANGTATNGAAAEPEPPAATVFLTLKEQRQLREKQERAERQRLREEARRHRPPKVRKSRPTPLHDLLLDVATHALVGEFSFSDLAVIAFARFPERFALEGYPEVPDTRTVWCALYAARGPLRTGKIVRAEDGKFAVARREGVTP